MKSTIEEIRQRRLTRMSSSFSNLEIGQSATVDAPLAMALVAKAASFLATPHARHVLDVGCGSGATIPSSCWNTRSQPGCHADRSEQAHARSSRGNASAKLLSGKISLIQGDVRDVVLPSGRFDIILAAAVLHHLRTDTEWQVVYASFHRALNPGGSLCGCSIWSSSEIPEAVQELMTEKYGEYLTRLKDDAYRDHVFEYVEKEDTPTITDLSTGPVA